MILSNIIFFTIVFCVCFYILYLHFYYQKKDEFDNEINKDYFEIKEGLFLLACHDIHSKFEETNNCVVVISKLTYDAYKKLINIEIYNITDNSKWFLHGLFFKYKGKNYIRFDNNEIIYKSANYEDITSYWIKFKEILK